MKKIIHYALALKTVAVAAIAPVEEYLIETPAHAVSTSDLASSMTMMVSGSANNGAITSELSGYYEPSGWESTVTSRSFEEPTP
jgi:hypothetical protein